MRNPYGAECKYFYGDYHRGRNLEECSLLKSASITWRKDYCKKCPVPSILRANACEYMVLSPRMIQTVLQPVQTDGPDIRFLPKNKS